MADPKRSVNEVDYHISSKAEPTILEMRKLRKISVSLIQVVWRVQHSGGILIANIRRLAVFGDSILCGPLLP